MNTINTNTNTNININTNINTDTYSNDVSDSNIEEYVEIDLNEMVNILANKINSIQLISDKLIKELCEGVIIYCKRHNDSLNEWFDIQYFDELMNLKNNNDDYLKLLNQYQSNSFIIIENVN